MSNIVKITRGISRAGLVLQKHSPTILTVGGIAGGFVAGALAVRATLKAEPVIDELNRGRLEVGKRNFSDPREKSKHLGSVYGLYAGKLFRLYAPALGVGALSAASVLWGHGIMKGRNAAITASFVAMERSFEKYRERVREELGEPGVELDKRWSSGEEIVEDENGDPHLVVRTDYTHPYVFCFGELNPEWSKEDDYNQHYLRLKQRMWNDTLASRGHVFLNEVLSDLGFDHTPTGAVTGWLWSGDGDGFIDFGLNKQEDAKSAFREGDERGIWLEFNVDGVIYDRI